MCPFSGRGVIIRAREVASVKLLSAPQVMNFSSPASAPTRRICSTKAQVGPATTRLGRHNKRIEGKRAFARGEDRERIDVDLRDFGPRGDDRTDQRHRMRQRRDVRGW